MINSQNLAEILNYLCETLGGNWLITGGSLVRLKFDETRGTEDLDLLRISDPKQSEECSRNQLFKWLMGKSLGPEWVNTAVEPFVKEVSTWQNEIVLIQSGQMGSIFRPNLTLFTYLKLRRGTEIDVKDVIAAIPHCTEGFDEKKFLQWADATLKTKYLSLKSKLNFS